LVLSSCYHLLFNLETFNGQLSSPCMLQRLFECLTERLIKMTARCLGSDLWPAVSAFSRLWRSCILTLLQRRGLQHWRWSCSDCKSSNEVFRIGPRPLSVSKS
jgi:hypothetical protein